jgi:sodium-dependent dicarboxylate transporter 2/3/5
MAHATGLIEQKDMVKVGVVLGLVGLVLGYGVLIILGSNGLI